LLLDLSAAPLTLPHAGDDLIYYERESPPGFISLDQVLIEVCADAACLTAFPVFNWGDGAADLNTHLGLLGYGAPEADNQIIPLADLRGTPPYQTGIAIDVDAVAPADVYPWIRITSPLGGANDPTEVDAVEVLP
jgi:hypothetical protein